MDAINASLSGIRRADSAGIYTEYLLTVYVYVLWPVYSSWGFGPIPRLYLYFKLILSFNLEEEGS